MNLKKAVKIGIATSSGNQNELAAYIDKTPQTLSKYLSGKIDPPWSVVKLMCDYFEVSVEQFCKWGGDE